MDDSRRSQPDDCIFCEIVRGSAPASLVYQDEVASAFMDIQPVNPGHVLVIPNRHATNLSELPPESGGYLFQLAQRVAAALRRSSIRCEGIDLFLADGEVAGQEIFHVHLHVIPRYQGDGFGFVFGPNYLNRPDRAALDRAAGLIRPILTETQDERA